MSESHDLHYIGSVLAGAPGAAGQPLRVAWRGRGGSNGSGSGHVARGSGSAAHSSRRGAGAAASQPGEQISGHW